MNNSVPVKLASALFVLYGDKQFGVMFQVIFSDLNKLELCDGLGFL